LRFVQAHKNGSTNEEYGILAESNFGINPEKRERERERERERFYGRVVEKNRTRIKNIEVG
jgi:hypothetical protein